MHFDELTFEQASAYKDHIAARVPVRLTDLAHWMSADGGPVESMDGTLGSLVPLWVWYRSFHRKDHAGVELAGPPSPFAVFGLPESPSDDWRGAYVIEAMASYLATAIFLADPGAIWKVYDWKTRGAVDSNFHHTGILVSTGHFIKPSQIVASQARRLVQNTEQPDPEAALQRVLSVYDGWLSSLPPEVSDDSILTPLLSDAPLPLDHPRRALPDLSRLPAAIPPPAKDRAGGQLILAMGSWESFGERPHDRLKPLPHGAVSDALTRAGFIDGDKSISADSVLVDDATFEHELGWAVAQTVVSRNRLRAVAIEGLDANKSEWQELCRRLKEFAASIGATLA